MSPSRGLALRWALALGVVALFTRLGFWQLARMHQKQAMLTAVAQVVAGRAPRPLSIAASVSRATDYDWTSAEGRFLAAPAVLLDNQSRGERVGIRVYRVFQSSAAGVAPVLVDLGWLPMPGDRRMPQIAPITGAFRVDGVLAPPPSAGLVRAAAIQQASGNLLTIALDLPMLRRALRLPTLAPRVLKLNPALPIGYARDLDVLPNTLPPERHLGYAVQWFGMALTVLITALLLTFRKPRVHAPR